MATNGKRTVFHNFQLLKGLFSRIAYNRIGRSKSFSPKDFCMCVCALYLIALDDFAKEILDIDIVSVFIHLIRKVSWLIRL